MADVRVVWSPELLAYDFGDGHPMNPLRLDLTDHAYHYTFVIGGSVAAAGCLVFCILYRQFLGLGGAAVAGAADGPGTRPAGACAGRWPRSRAWWSPRWWTGSAAPRC